jgi:hypothetical protein
MRRRKRERRENYDVVVRDTKFGGGGDENVSPVLQVPRQCLFVLLVEVSHMIGNSFVLYNVRGVPNQF